MAYRHSLAPFHKAVEAGTTINVAVFWSVDVSPHRKQHFAHCEMLVCPRTTVTAPRTPPSLLILYFADVSLFERSTLLTHHLGSGARLCAHRVPFCVEGMICGRRHFDQAFGFGFVLHRQSAAVSLLRCPDLESRIWNSLADIPTCAACSFTIILIISP